MNECLARPEPSAYRKWLERLFPSQWCETPEAPSHFKDVIFLETRTYFDLKDRLRVLFSGRIRIHAKIVTENTVGEQLSAAVVYVLPPEEKSKD